ncbi:hypothetical protein BH11PAT2_BH11PAT2_01450 [soil metagenome]
MKILITGIPGTGKTTIGDYLESEKGFLHLNMERTSLEEMTRFHESSAPNKVITWGFVPIVQNADIKNLQELGYKMFWFDGNREAARREFIERGDVPEDLLDAQLSRIESLDLSIFNPTLINTFDANGLFYTKEQIANMLIQ